LPGQGALSYRRLVANPRILIAAALSMLALLAVPASAAAVTNVAVQQPSPGTSVVVAADDDSAGDIQTTLGVDPGTMQPFVAVQNAGGVTAGSGCFVANPPTNTIVGCEGTFAGIVVFGNGGNDKVTMDLIADGLPPLPGRAVGGDGDDEISTPPDGRVGISHPTTILEGSGGNDKIVGGNGADELLGGDGNDTLDAHQGPDTVRGEGGNDSVSGGKEEPAPNAADVVDGGPGFDTIPNLVNDYDRLFDDDVSITLDNQANDGEPGEGDNVIAVEKVNIVANHATFVGTDAAEDVFVESNSSTVRGLGGNDRLVTYDGNDDIDGGEGDDFLQGGFGNDTLTGGPGVDQFSGDRTESDVFAVGNDQIFARDGNVEQISCGLGSDRAEVDAKDVVDASCESVDRDSVAFGAKTLVTLRLVSARIPARGPLPVRIVNANGFAVTGGVSGQTTKPVTVSRKRRVSLKRRSFSVGANSRKTVKLKLPAALRRVLKRTGRLSLRLTVRVKDPADNTRIVRKKVTPKLRR
jgi:Ca2+-binding RTX toxin-like protein